mmetsp:Transcript_15440/g.23137  ORF Transcript_15440/g.23137 Transcript_15440/m.23137 type:complete len:180 (-) Transcript_15440:342-881(-)|eukprot:CAMPEP_0194083496 /NCGR_PEP_ID=MMETSP0149-20130528/9419_1 /TAXON_ID=122233 /ORGANISM="Chaetoceros debilis, Strain MM31A-1" /LENGTH=179 /DNA_ID=CAMNT_0038765921 /DNA_START=44 /DNA_END=583 /DNA_ORIENTATION=-
MKSVTFASILSLSFLILETSALSSLFSTSNNVKTGLGGVAAKTSEEDLALTIALSLAHFDELDDLTDSQPVNIPKPQNAATASASLAPKIEIKPGTRRNIQIKASKKKVNRPRNVPLSSLNLFSLETKQAKKLEKFAKVSVSPGYSYVSAPAISTNTSIIPTTVRNVGAKIMRMITFRN